MSIQFTYQASQRRIDAALEYCAGVSDIELEFLASRRDETGHIPPHSAVRALREINAELVAALEGIFAQTAKHSRQWGQIESAAAFARDPATAQAFAAARQVLARVKG